MVVKDNLEVEEVPIGIWKITGEGGATATNYQ